MDIQKEREAFEIAYHATHSPIIKRPYPILKDGDYQYLEIDQAWKLWQAKTQVPEGFVLVPKVITDEWMATYVDAQVIQYCKDFEDLPWSVRDSELPEIRESYRLPIRNAHKRLMQVIEAQEQAE